MAAAPAAEDKKMVKPANINPIIHEIRGHQVMLDADLAVLYQVETGALNRAVKRNINKFPPEFMFQLTDEEFDRLRCQIGISNADLSLRSQIATSKIGRGGRRYLPFAFTEHGVIMLSSVLNSQIATQINIAIVKAFVATRHYLSKPIGEKLADLEKVLMLHIDDTNHNFSEHTAAINDIIDKLNALIDTPKTPRRPIGFAAPDNKKDK